MKRIAVLTSGGNSQGMNACLIGAGRVCRKKGVELWAINNGFRGLLAGDMMPLELTNRLATYLQQTAGGTVIGTSRFPEFKKIDVRHQARLMLQRHHIDGLIVIGGNGSYCGALGLVELGVKCVTIPGTIDNDVAKTDYTVGFDTTANLALSYLDRLRTTAESHGGCQILEVMGRDCGDIAIYSGIAGLADLIITKNTYLPVPTILQRLQKLARTKKRSVLIVVVEKLYDVHDLAQNIAANTPFHYTRASVLGYGQRGGAPSANDRVRGLLMGIRAVELLLEGGSGLELVVRGTQISSVKLDRLVQTQEHDHLLRLYQSYQL